MYIYMYVCVCVCAHVLIEKVLGFIDKKNSCILNFRIRAGYSIQIAIFPLKVQFIRFSV